MQEGDAEDAEEEDAAREEAADNNDGLDLAERQAQVQFEEQQLLEAADDLDDTFINSPPGFPEMTDEEEWEEETEKQRLEDKDYAPTRNPSTATLAESDLTEIGPHRCMTNLEALSSVASRTQTSHYNSALLANAGFDDMKMIGPKTTLDPAKVLRARISYGEHRTKARLAKAQKMDAIYFDEWINTTVIQETANTKVIMGRGVEEEATKFVQRTAKEEHCPVLMYGPPGEVYIETNKLEEGTGRVLAEQLVQSLEKQQSKDTVRVIGSDSC